MEIPQRLVRTRAAAPYCGYAASTFEKLRCVGGGPRFVKRGRTVLYDLRDLDLWLASLPRYESTSEAAEAEAGR